MIAYNLASVISSIFDQVRYQNQVRDGNHYRTDNDFVKNPDVALYLTLEVSAENSGYEIDGNTHRPEWCRRFQKEMHFLMTAQCKIFLAITDGKWRSLSQIPNSAWQNTSNHDSCWRTDGVQSPIVKVMFEAWEHCFSHMPEEHLREKLRSSGVDMELSHRRGPIRFVRIKHEAIDESNSYHRKITSVKELVPVIGFKEE